MEYVNQLLAHAFELRWFDKALKTKISLSLGETVLSNENWADVRKERKRKNK